jgi:hypothetical protein
VVRLVGVNVGIAGLLGLAVGPLGLVVLVGGRLGLAAGLVVLAGVAVSLALAAPNAGWNQSRSLEARLSVPRSAWGSGWTSAARSSSGARSMSVLRPTSGA